MFHVPNQFRVSTAPLTFGDESGNNGAFELSAIDGILRIVASDGLWFEPIKGYETLYEISHIGQIKALTKIIPLPNGAKRHHEETLLKLDYSTDYPRVKLCDKRGQKNHLVHRLVATAFIPNPHSYPFVNHRDGVKENFNVENLEWCDQSYNIHHAIENGSVAGLAESDIERIKGLIAKGESCRSIATEYSRSRQAIGDVKGGRHRDLNPQGYSKYTGIPLWEHVSISLQHRIPVWQEMSSVKDLFWDEEDLVIQYHPPKSEYINCHPRTLHLWRKTGTNKFCEVPPTYLIGPK